MQLKAKQSTHKAHTSTYTKGTDTEHRSAHTDPPPPHPLRPIPTTAHISTHGTPRCPSNPKQPGEGGLGVGMYRGLRSKRGNEACQHKQLHSDANDDKLTSISKDHGSRIKLRCCASGSVTYKCCGLDVRLCYITAHPLSSACSRSLVSARTGFHPFAF